MKEFLVKVLAFFKKAFNFFKEPPTFVKVLAFVFALLFIGGAMTLLIVGYTQNLFLEILAYTLFALSALSLAYCVYIIVRWVPAVKSKVVDMIESHKFTRSLKEDYGFRTVIFAIGSFCMSVAFAVFNAYMGIAFKSLFNGMLSAYYIALALIRGGILIHHGKGARRGEDYHERDEERKAGVYRNVGVIILVLSVALSVAIAQMIFDDRHFSYPGWTVFAFAAYAFFKITMSIINLFKSRKQDDLTVTAIRNVNLTDATVSILALQTALLHTFSGGDIDISLFNTLTGSVVSLVTYAIGIIMIVVGIKTLKKIRMEKKNGK